MDKRKLGLPAAVAAAALMAGLSMAGAQQAGQKAQQDQHVQAQKNTGQKQPSAQSGQSGQNQASANLDRGQIREVQRALDQKGLKAGRADGVMGQKTENALRSFQQRQGLEASGQVDEQTLAKLGLNDLARPSTVGQGGQSTQSPPRSQAQNSNPSSQAQGSSPSSTGNASAANSAFVRDAIQGDLAEMQVGKLAQQKGSSDKVKQFAQKLYSDHSANLDKAKSLAQTVGVAAPNQPSADQKAVYDKLNKLSGTQFDQEFAKSMVEDHQKDITKFQQESQGSGPAADFAKQTLPTLREHLQLAQSLSGSTTGSAAH